VITVQAHPVDERRCTPEDPCEPDNVVEFKGKVKEA
jgi:hypothetical protein